MLEETGQTEGLYGKTNAGEDNYVQAIHETGAGLDFL